MLFNYFMTLQCYGNKALYFLFKKINSKYIICCPRLLIENVINIIRIVQIEWPLTTY